MFRFIAMLLGKEYEPCRTCIELRSQLNLVREDKLIEHQEECESCSVLQAQLDHALEREKILIERLLQLSEPEKIPIAIPGTDNRLNKTMPFRTAQRIREEQDRISAKKLKDLADLERELKMPATEAEAEAEAKRVAEAELDKEFQQMAGIEHADDQATGTA